MRIRIFKDSSIDILERKVNNFLSEIDACSEEVKEIRYIPSTSNNESTILIILEKLS